MAKFLLGRKSFISGEFCMKYREFTSSRLLVGLLMALLFTKMSLAAELNESEFRSLQRQLQPPADAPWRTIPWKITLIEAQRTAIQEKKPIFIWAMDGHPLGCT